MEPPRSELPAYIQPGGLQGRGEVKQFGFGLPRLSKQRQNVLAVMLDAEVFEVRGIGRIGVVVL
jgi:hypothetical protein